ncbi:2Fe-2S iron-sulfur cluster binding domain-containing protein [Ramlibacter sp. USB13]|uniref:2Fe-2S iron-sulfur cluster binding domain-containing protein n=1 Tax=Ramlibacter cellulosilyticus TaxID=2764187 RepID=A0A923SDF2_9BURK|nr:2Fe-2S iron-sulfur cluster-binding protein [Ramlibacter cellulosilyticus]MBC5785950.1 2Fe-2S iron-sulfur cluster binding domain-containing protein [Ramlibacter cellulosilyticus]
MITIHLWAPDGAETTLQAREGESLMQAAVAANVPWIAADCGGMLTCATCHVYVREPFAARLPAPQADELAMLEFAAAERRPTSRLSCQVELTRELDGLAVDLPETQY